MNFNTFLLCLLIIPTYLNLYLTLKKLRMKKKRTELPISSKQWSEKIKDNTFNDWLANSERLKK